MLAFLEARTIAGVEMRDGPVFRRSLSLVREGLVHRGCIEVSLVPGQHALGVSVPESLVPVLSDVVARVAHVFDVACDPAAIVHSLGPLAADAPGLRVPGVFDGFEAGVRAIAGQQVSVRAMAILLSRIAARYGAPLAAPESGLAVTFPDAATLARVPVEALASLGMPRTRARTIVTLAAAVVDGLELRPGVDVESTLARLLALPGIGPWTAQYIAMRGLGWRDAFLHSDLGVNKALGETRPARVLAQAEAWRPWRAYAVIHLWDSQRKRPT